MNSVIYPDIAERLRWHVTFTGLTEGQYAVSVEAQRSQVSNWRLGYSRPSLDAGLKLCDRYGLTLDFIYRGDDRLLPQHLFDAWRTRKTDAPKA